MTYLSIKYPEPTPNEFSKKFLTNRSGFPMDDRTWTKMFQFCCHLYPDYEDQILALMRKDSKDITYPVPPIRLMGKLNSAEKLSAIQSYMSSLQYNYTGTQFFAIPKFRPIIRLVDTAREIIRDSLPIKCLEGVILAVFLTQGHTELKRFTISFKSKFNDQKHRHIVLGIYCRGYFGALGMSRREDLMYKPLEFHCLSDLVGSYLKAYASYEHIVQKLKIGGPIPHEPHMLETIMWRGLSISPVHASEARMSHLIENYSKQLTSSYARFTIQPVSVKLPELQMNINRQKNSTILQSGESTSSASTLPALKSGDRKDTRARKRVRRDSGQRDYFHPKI